MAITKILRIYNCKDSISNLNDFTPSLNGTDICIVEDTSTNETHYYYYVNDEWVQNDELKNLFGKTTNHRYYMNQAITQANQSIKSKSGGPFGAVIVKDNQIIAFGRNKVLKDNDPTAHGEIVAIRDACQKLKTYDLSGCILYTTGYPCPMCLCAILWAKIDKVYYGCNLSDAERLGFCDERYYELLKDRDQLVVDENTDRFLEQVGHEECLDLFYKYHHTDHEIY